MAKDLPPGPEIGALNENAGLGSDSGTPISGQQNRFSVKCNKDVVWCPETVVPTPELYTGGPAGSTTHPLCKLGLSETVLLRDCAKNKPIRSSVPGWFPKSLHLLVNFIPIQNCQHIPNATRFTAKYSK